MTFEQEPKVGESVSHAGIWGKVLQAKDERM